MFQNKLVIRIHQSIENYYNINESFSGIIIINFHHQGLDMEHSTTIQHANDEQCYKQRDMALESEEINESLY